MAAGFQASLSIPILNGRAGAIAASLHTAFMHVREMRAQLLAITDADLLALGFAQPDIDNIKSAFADLDQLRTIYEGSATLGVAKNFTTVPRRLMGVEAV